MRRSPETATAARAVPLAAGAALVLVAVAVSVARHRPRRPGHDDGHRPIAAPTAPLRRDVVAVDAPLPPGRPPPAAPPARRATLAPIGITAALLLGGLGLGLVGIALASQRSAAQTPETPRSEALAEVASGRLIEGWGAAMPAIAAPRLPDGPTSRLPAPKPVPVVLTRSLPVSLHIPAIDVRSPLHHLGQADDGSLQTPRPGPYYNDAAWYRHSPTPGSMGPAILLGHVDSAAEGPSVFFRLGELTAGDRVAVTRADDSVAVFRVDRVRRYAKDDFPTGLVYGDIDHSGLRLVTCGGAFDNASGHYLDNVVVFASLVV